MKFNEGFWGVVVGTVVGLLLVVGTVVTARMVVDAQWQRKINALYPPVDCTLEH